MAKNKIVKLDDYRQRVVDSAADPHPPVRRKQSSKSRKLAVETAWRFGGFTEPDPFLTEMMSVMEKSGPLPDVPRLLQSGVLAFQRAPDHEPRILLVSKKQSNNWGIPKGNVEPFLTFPQSAAKEAFEEAGVLGHISPYPIGVFRARKRSADSRSHRVIEVWIYLLEVTDALSNWPEKHKRQAKWVSCEAAARHLREPVLARLCRRLARG